MTSHTDSSPEPARPSAGPPGLLIRATRAEDFEGVARLINLPGFRAGTLRLPYQKAEEVRKWMEADRGDGLNIVAVLDGEIVGQAGLNRYSGRRSHVAGLGMGVHDDHVGKGIGTTLVHEIVDAADNWLAIRRLELTVYTDNHPAIRLYEKFGFEREGVQRWFAFGNGHYVDAIGMARLRRWTD